MNSYYLYRKAWLSNLPPHEEKHLKEPEYKALLRNGGLMVRNTYDFDKNNNSFWFIIKDNFKGLEELNHNTRRKIRKSLKTYNYLLINKKHILDNGYDIIKSAFADYPVKDRNISKKWFNDYFNKNEDNYHFWGCFEKENNRLAGFSFNHVWDEACEYNFMCILPECRKNATYPYYGLLHSMNQYYLGEKKMRYVSDGARSITQHSNIQLFLRKNFNFRKAYCKLDIHYQWWFGLIVKSLYPFRKYISLPKVKAILRQEEFFRTQNKF